MPLMALSQCKRSDPLETIRKAKRIIDEQSGIIRILYENPCEPDDPKIFGYGSILADSRQYGPGHASPVNGSTSIIRERAIAGAIGEAVERYSAGIVPDDELSCDPYRSVRGDAIDPRSLVLYSKQQYQQPTFPYVPFHEDVRLRWVQAYSLTRGVEVLLPAFAVYIPYERVADEPPLVQLISTGLACGNTLEEAILSGIFEVVERDSVMCMWLHQRPRPHLDCQAVDGTILQETLQRFDETIYELHLIDVTTDIKIPSVVAVAIDRSGRGPAAVFASNSSLNPQDAVVGALDELAQCLTWVRSLMRRHPPEQLPPLDQLSSIEDHVLWPTRLDRLGLVKFVVESPKRRSIAWSSNRAIGDVSQDIRTCVELLAECGLEVVVVDITPADIREIGLNVVRVAIPGVQPLYFGSGLERISPRIHQYSYGVDDPGGLLRDRQSRINQVPHPFP